MIITLHYYAILREQSGLASERLEVTSSDLRQLYRQLQRRFSFSLPEAYVRPAVNDELCAWERPITDGDQVVFLPPASGG